MTKLSSRLQSRIAKRRSALRHVDGQRAMGKEMNVLGMRLLDNDLISQEAFNTHLAGYRRIRKLGRDLAMDQQLDKQLLKITYLHENSFLSLADAELSDSNVIVLRLPQG